MASRSLGSIVGLRPEYDNWYRVLHKHVFPGVLDRISRSNIRNYSIYLHANILFSRLEHIGDDYAADMAAMAADERTREWWTLTDPMQTPLPERAEGEWWARLSLWHEEGASRARRAVRGAPCPHPRDGERGAGDIRRLAFVVRKPACAPAASVLDGIDRLEVFEARDRLYVYAEVAPSVEARDVAVALREKLQLANEPTEIEEVFHTDGLPAFEASPPPPAPSPRKKVFVTGCFDMLHSGHVAFLREAAQYGDVYVGIGSDATIRELKGRYTVNSQDERKYMIEALDCVHECRVNGGSGFLDFEQELADIKPDVLVVNEDGHSPAKEALCRGLGIEYRVLQRIPHAGLPPRTTTTLRTENRIPYRIDLAGGWLDQPFVSKHHPGPVLTISIEPTIEFNDRSGMASSTRRKAIELWRTAVPHGDPEHLAKVLFSYDNPPGTDEVSGSQDALGIVLPGLNRLYYDGGYWPSVVESVHDEDTLSWIERHLHLVTLGPRVHTFNVLQGTRIDASGARRLSEAAEDCWKALLHHDARAFGDAFRRSFEAQVAMFPHMLDGGIGDVVEEYRHKALGWKLSGAGGGGYLILIMEGAAPNTVGIKIRRRDGD